ncbi:MAG: UDP-glucose/GDP-mannose dehydrogenase family protein [Nitrospinae bacterium]|nr:UDP-glucose/GDP-mannose dehydrogenase family protein [Nitrospinota bacterium]
MERLAVIGSGYVGLVTAACLADKGFHVVCADKNPEIVKKINSAVAPIHEKGLDDVLRRTVENGRLRAVESPREAAQGAEIVFIAVGTPFDGNEIDLSQMKSACADIAPWLAGAKNRPVVVVKSTVVPTTAELVVVPLLEKLSAKKAGVDFGVCSNPEFLREGNAVADFNNPDRIVVGGLDSWAVEKVRKIYAWSDAPVVAVNPRTAEMIKYASNSLLATLISFTNEIANISYAAGGIDVKEVTAGLHLDFRLNPSVDGRRLNPNILTYIEAGCGFGGSCFPKDVSSLVSFAKSLDAPAGLLEKVMEINVKQPLRVLELVKGSIGALAGKKTAVLGLAFKPDTSDTRESPSIPLVRGLLGEGAEVIAYDPLVGDEFNKIEGCGALKHANGWRDAVRGASAAVLMTRWDEFKEITEEELARLMSKPVLVDARRFFDKKKFARITYAGIGYRPASNNR